MHLNTSEQANKESSIRTAHTVTLNPSPQALTRQHYTDPGAGTIYKHR